MAYTVKQVAAMSAVSVRTLHFYDATGLLKPAHYGANGYRFYEEPQLLTLQQILFYRCSGIRTDPATPRTPSTAISWTVSSMP
jgi:DNA-binding transcriptional MerR regulator